MVIQIFDREEQVAKAGATLIATQLIEEPESVLGFATGSSPLGVYAELARLCQEGVLSFSAATTFNLDEYYGLPRDHEQSYYKFMVDNLFSKVDIPLEQVNLPNGEASDAQEECLSYEDRIADYGGVDLQLLGIGRNGHIGFNEPSTVFEAETHLVDLTEDTIDANKRFFNSADEVPKQALTMGIGTIMHAHKIVLVATGQQKAKAVQAMVQGPIDPQCPASILQLHPNVTLLLDKEAAALL